MSKVRCFIALEIPDEIKNFIKEIQEKLPPFIGKKTELENLHLTLKFLGEIDEKTVDKVKERLKKIKFNKIKGKIDSIGVFSPQYIRIIWLHVEGVEHLQKKVDEVLSDLFKKEERFMSHLTIARVKKIENKKEFLEKLNRIKFNPIDFCIDKFYLKKSTLTTEKAIYENLEIYNLTD